MRYKKINKNKENGVVYTPERMAEYVSNLMLHYTPSREVFTENVRVLDPAVGEGELIVSLVNALVNKGVKKIDIVGYETDEIVGQKTYSRLTKLFPELNVDIRIEDFLVAVENNSIGKYDFIIANPPYIRTQILGADKAKIIAEKLGLSGRIDIYYAFLLYAKEAMKETGIAGFITSNKFLTIKSGASVREYMLSNYNIKHIVDLGDTKLFNASVLPCIAVFTHGSTLSKDDVNFTSIYETISKIPSNNKYEDIFEFLNSQGIFELNSGKTYSVQQGKIMNLDPKNSWSVATSSDIDFMYRVYSNTWITFSDIGKIRVGIKTTADNVFIGNDWESKGENIELLKPLITHRNAGQIISKNDEHWKVLYTHKVINGKKTAIDINDYPNSKDYLINHFQQLDSRNYIKKANRNWYEIWVPQNPDAWNNKKIIFRDISEHPQFWIDETGSVVNGDCYWIEIKENVDEDVIYLALAIANSEFIERFYDSKFNNKLYSGKRRFQTQYVQQFPIPYLNREEAKEAIRLVKKIIADQEYSISDKGKLNELVEKLFK